MSINVEEVDLKSGKYLYAVQWENKRLSLSTCTKATKTPLDLLYQTLILSLKTNSTEKGC